MLEMFADVRICREMSKMSSDVVAFLHLVKSYSCKIVQRGLLRKRLQKMLRDVAYPLNSLISKIQESEMLTKVAKAEKGWKCYGM